MGRMGGGCGLKGPHLPGIRDAEESVKWQF